MSGRVGVRRWKFLCVFSPEPLGQPLNSEQSLETLQDLDSSLSALGSRLLVVRGSPEAVFPILFTEWRPHSLVYELDTEPFAIQRDARVTALASAAGIQSLGIHGHTLYPPSEILSLNKGKAPLTYNSFLKVFICTTEGIKSHPPMNAWH